MRFLQNGVAIALAALIAGCGSGSLLRGVLPSTSPHERHAQGLERAGLARTGMVQAWREAADQALQNPLPLSLPYHEATFAPSDEITAAGYRVPVRLGQKLIARVEPEGDSLEVFADLFEVTDGRMTRVASADAEGLLEFEPPRDDHWVLRVQPELLRSGRYMVTITATPTLGFPVAGRANVGGVFGDPRDGGARDHQGIDIFARRGTPVVASAAGIVGSTAENGLGGIVVWLHDPERRQALYYAHLDRRRVEAGEQVAAGDTIGFVGNTGNARTSPPHLHFGVYRSGPVDPLPFVRASDPAPAITAPDSWVDRWARVRDRAVPVAGGTALTRGSVVRVRGAAADGFRAEMPDGRQARIAARALERSDPALERLRIARTTLAREAPAEGAAVVDTLRSGDRVAVHGHFGDYRFVRLEQGRMSWVRT